MFHGERAGVSFVIDIGVALGRKRPDTIIQAKRRRREVIADIVCEY